MWTWIFIGGQLHIGPVRIILHIVHRQGLLIILELIVSSLPNYFGVWWALVQLQIVELYLTNVCCGHIGGWDGFGAGLSCLVQYLLGLLLIREIVARLLTGIGHYIWNLEHIGCLAGSSEELLDSGVVTGVIVCVLGGMVWGCAYAAISWDRSSGAKAMTYTWDCAIECWLNSFMIYSHGSLHVFLLIAETSDLHLTLLHTTNYGLLMSSHIH